MDEFILSIDEIRFRQTNGAWNELFLNDPWSVGYVSNLIETQPFATKEQWEQFYYDSGHERDVKIVSLGEKEQQLLNKHTLKRTHPEQLASLGQHLRRLNYQFGRTRLQLAEKGALLHQYVAQKGIDVALEECIECVRYRTICETWNGIMFRERNTVKKLKTLFPSFEFTKTTGDFDHRYAVDYELSETGTVFCGIQIKPRSYTYNTPYLTKARNANKRKNQQYTDTFHRPVFDVISQTSGAITNPDVLDKIRLVKKSS